MTTSALVVVAGLAAGTWLLWRIPTPPPAQHEQVRTCTSIIIPARNEERSLPRLLASLAIQRPPPLEVIVVDDGSTDGTADLARSGGAHLIDAGPLPAGWLGKPWACSKGASAARSPTLVFLDADVELGKDGLARLLRAHAEQAPDGLLSVQPHHLARRAHEQLSAVCNVVSMMATGAFRPGSSADDQAVAFGPCLVTSTEAYRSAGSHAAVAGELIEDVHLARAYRSAGRPIRCLVGGTAVSFRMYPTGTRQLVEGWTKNLAGGPGLVPVFPLVGSVAWVTAVATVAVHGVAMAWTAPTGAGWWPAVAWPAVAVQLTWILRRIGSFRWWVASAFPVPLAAFVALFARSWARRTLRHQVRWRGRNIDVRGPR